MPEEQQGANGKNFRTGYYEKVGYKGVDVKKSLELLLAENPADVFKMSQFGLKYPLSNVHRVVLWKVLLGVSPRHSAGFSFIEQQRYAQTELLRKSLFTMRLNDPVPQVSADVAEQRNFLKMFLLEQGKLGYNVTSQCEEDSCRMFLTMAAVVSDVVADFCDRYWLTKSIFSHVQHHSSNIVLVVRYAESVIRVRMPDLLIKLDRLNFSLPLTRWFFQLNADLQPKIIVKIWDKILCGSWEILCHLAVAVLQSLTTRLLMCRSMDEVETTMKQIPVETQDLIVLKTLESWENSGRLLLPPADPRDRANSVPSGARNQAAQADHTATGHSGRRSVDHQNSQPQIHHGLVKTVSSLK